MLLSLNNQSYSPKTSKRRRIFDLDMDKATEMTFFSGDRSSYWTDVRIKFIKESNSLAKIKEIFAIPYHDFNWQIIFDAFPVEQSIVDHLKSLPPQIKEEFLLIRRTIQFLSAKEFEKYDITITRIASYLKKRGMCPNTYDAEKMIRAIIVLDQRSWPTRNRFEIFRNIKKDFGKDDYFFNIKNALFVLDEELLNLKMTICKLSGNSVLFLNKENIDIDDTFIPTEFIKNELNFIFHSLNKENLNPKYTFEFVNNCKLSIREYFNSNKTRLSLFLSIFGLFLAQARFGNIFLDEKELLVLNSLKEEYIKPVYYFKNINSHIESLKKIQKTQNKLALKTFLFSIEHTQQPSALEAGFGAISDLASIVAEYSYREKI
jgi:hypothetical protein